MWVRGRLGWEDAVTVHSAIPVAEWQPLAPEGLGFQAMLPGVAREDRQSQETEAGAVVTNKFSVIPKGKEELFMIVAVAFPEQVATNLGGAENVLEIGKQDVLTALQGTLESEQPISLDGKWLT